MKSFPVVEENVLKRNGITPAQDRNRIQLGQRSSGNIKMSWPLATFSLLKSLLQLV